MKLTQQQKVEILAQKIEDGRYLSCPGCTKDLAIVGFDVARLSWTHETYFPELNIEEDELVSRYWDKGDYEDPSTEIRYSCRSCGHDLPFNLKQILEKSMEW